MRVGLTARLSPYRNQSEIQHASQCHSLSFFCHNLSLDCICRSHDLLGSFLGLTNFWGKMRSVRFLLMRLCNVLD
jgi:hypothetical protein